MSKLVIFNKPFRVLPQFTDKEGRDTLATYLPYSDVYPAGRLDYDSEGLMLLTDDGRLQAQISHPRYKLAKTYWVQVEGVVSEEQCSQLCRGVTLNDGPACALSCRVLNEPVLWARNPPIRQRASIPVSWIELKIDEGRNRQVRRMTAAVGLPPLRLVRVAIGQWTLDGLQPGEHRQDTVHMPQPKRARSSRKARTPGRRS